MAVEPTRSQKRIVTSFRVSAGGGAVAMSAPHSAQNFATEGATVPQAEQVRRKSTRTY
jgi:hypothetical protein